MSYFLGPDIGRWTPDSWADVVKAAEAGTLDETHWVELKLAVPPTSRDANLELARDLAALALDGGLLIIGIADDDDHAGAVEGTALYGLADRIEQVARNRVDPPLVVRTVEIPHPDDPGRGCLLVVVPASADAPHMVDQRYWGRGERSKRVLPDTEVRRHIAASEQAQGTFVDLAAARRGAFPVRGDGVLHLLVRPRAGRVGAASAEIDAARNLLHRLTEGMPRCPHGWSVMGHLQHVQRVVHGARLSNLTAEEAAGMAGDFSTISYPAVALQLDDDGTVEFGCSMLVEERAGREVDGLRASTQGFVSLTRQVLDVAFRFGDLVGHGGMWDIDLHIAGLHGARPAPEQNNYLTGLYGSVWVEDAYSHTVGITAMQLADAQSVVEILLRPLLRVFGVEHQLASVEPARAAGGS